MKYRVHARDYWSSELQARFGDMDSIHELTDTEVVDVIRSFGRAEIFPDGDIPETERLQLWFHNSYD